MNYIALFGVPRSGTSWLGQVFNSSEVVAYRFQPLFSYTFKDRLNFKSCAEDIQKFYDELIETKDKFILQHQNISKTDNFSFKKSNEPTHLVWKEVRYLNLIENIILNSKTSIIGIIRHPCAVINSWLNAPREFDKSWNPLQEWKHAAKKNKNRPEEFYGFEKWKEVAQLFLKLRGQHPDKFELIVYEELVTNTKSRVLKLFNNNDLEATSQTEGFLKESSNILKEDAYSVYKANKNIYSWRGTLPAQIQHDILNDKEFLYINEIIKWEDPKVMMF